jgi:hypothetical protein
MPCARFLDSVVAFSCLGGHLRRSRKKRAQFLDLRTGSQRLRFKSRASSGSGKVICVHSRFCPISHQYRRSALCSAFSAAASQTLSNDIVNGGVKYQSEMCFGTRFSSRLSSTRFRRGLRGFFVPLSAAPTSRCAPIDDGFGSYRRDLSFRVAKQPGVGPTAVCVSAACQSRAGRLHSCLLRAVKRS